MDLLHGEGERRRQRDDDDIWSTPGFREDPDKVLAGRETRFGSLPDDLRSRIDSVMTRTDDAQGYSCRTGGYDNEGRGGGRGYRDRRSGGRGGGYGYGYRRDDDGYQGYGGGGSYGRRRDAMDSGPPPMSGANAMKIEPGGHKKLSTGIVQALAGWFPKTPPHIHTFWV